MKKTKGVCSSAQQINFRTFFYAGYIRAPLIFYGSKYFHTPFLCCRKNGGQQIEVAVFRSMKAFQQSIFVKFRMRFSIVASMKSFFVGLPGSMIRKRLSGNLTPREATSVRECG